MTTVRVNGEAGQALGQPVFHFVLNRTALFSVQWSVIVGQFRRNRTLPAVRSWDEAVPQAGRRRPTGAAAAASNLQNY